jgi:broad specificity phosphatase PhoE
MRLIITRHGETIENRDRIIQGHLPGRLSELGKRQAQLLAKRLSRWKIDRVYSSDLARARDTAIEIIQYHPDIPLRYTERLREFHTGSWTGKKKPVHVHHPMLPPDGESRKHACARVKILLDNVLRSYPKDTVLFVGHSGINGALMTVIQEEEPDYMSQLLPSGNTALTVVMIEKGKKARVLTRDDSRHLKLAED